MTNVLMQNFPVLPVFSPNVVGTETVVSGQEETLSQNYPNPFTKTTTITFGSAGGQTVIELFDVTGRKVKTLVNQKYERGQHHLTINRDGLMPGNYFYRMTSGSEQATKKLVVVD